MGAINRWVGWLLVFAMGGLPCALHAEAPFPAALKPKPIARFLPGQEKGFGPLLVPARELVAQAGLARQANHFCALGYRYVDTTTVVLVHWREGRRLVLWEPAAEGYQAQALTMARRNLKLGVDTVARNRDINGSTYLVTRAWWEAVARDCEAYGEKVGIAPFSSNAPNQP